MPCEIWRVIFERIPLIHQFSASGRLRALKWEIYYQTKDHGLTGFQRAGNNRMNIEDTGTVQTAETKCKNLKLENRIGINKSPARRRELQH